MIAYHSVLAMYDTEEEGSISISKPSCPLKKELLAGDGFEDTEYDGQDVYRKEECTFRVLKQSVLGEGPVCFHTEGGVFWFPSKAETVMQTFATPMHARAARYKPY